jgi:hypothetical protein
MTAVQPNIILFSSKIVKRQIFKLVFRHFVCCDYKSKVSRTEIIISEFINKKSTKKIKKLSIQVINLSSTATMEPAAKKPKISEEKCLDPIENALFEHSLQEMMFQHLTGNEVKQIYEVSPLWNEIASASKTCGDKLRLCIDEMRKATRKSFKSSLRTKESTEHFVLTHEAVLLTKLSTQCSFKKS